MKKEKILLQKQTQYNRITIKRWRDIITLWSGGFKQTEIRLTNPIRPLLEYAQRFFLALAFHPEPQSILVMGLGGGVIPTLLHSILEKSVVDVVEIDPEMQEIAQTYFRFETSERLRLFIDDAFSFIRDSKQSYDLVIMDAYIGNQLPGTIDSIAFLTEIARVLSPQGIYSANLMSANPVHFKRMVKRINVLFNYIWLLPGEISTNTLVFASRQKIPGSKILEGAKRLRRELPFNLDTTYCMNFLEFYAEPPKHDDTKKKG